MLNGLIKRECRHIKHKYFNFPLTYRTYPSQSNCYTQCVLTPIKNNEQQFILKIFYTFSFSTSVAIVSGICTLRVRVVVLKFYAKYYTIEMN